MFSNVINPIDKKDDYEFPVLFVFIECVACLTACHIATGFRIDVSIWCQCLIPLSDAEQPTITCPIGFATVFIFSVVSDTHTTVKRIWIELSIYGGTLNIIDSL